MCMTPNCMFCNPNLPNMCVVCKVNYYMNTQGECVIDSNDEVKESLTSIIDYTENKTIIYASYLISILILNML